ncbi:MAG: hemerythrin domain-containing protein [Deltaproteobacteria bacterium]|nr:hemerythrin domain-containing protein [Deltaproteobacteria bacterium]
MTIYAVLHQEHVQLLRLLEKARRAPPLRRPALLKEAIDELSAHSRAEDEVLYERLADVAALHVATLAAREQHLVFTRILADLAVINPNDERCTAKITVLIDALKLHVEHEGPLFAQARQHFDEVIAENFGGEYVAAKQAAHQIPVDDRLLEALGRFGAPNPGMADEWTDDAGFKGLSEEPTANGYARFSGNF